MLIQILHSFINKWWDIPYSLLTNMLDHDVTVSSNSSCTIAFPFRLIPLGKA